MATERCVATCQTVQSGAELLDSDDPNSFGVLLIVLLGPINDRLRSPVAEGSLLGGVVGSAASGSWVCRGELCAHEYVRGCEYKHMTWVCKYECEYMCVHMDCVSVYGSTWSVQGSVGASVRV